MQIVWDQGLETPPGSHLRFQKIDETGPPGNRVFRYRIYAQGAVQGTQYLLGMWRIGTDLDNLEVVSESAFINRKGLLLGNPPNPAQQDSETLDDGSELDVSVKAARGEPVRFVLRTEDSKTMIAGTLVPAPIESTDKNCRLRALLADPDGLSVLLYVDGFPPNAVVAAHGASHGATDEEKIYTDAKGHGVLIETPHPKGIESGTLTETVQSPACAPKVDVPWGGENFHPM